MAGGDLEKFVARSAKTTLSDAKFKDMPLKAKMVETVRRRWGTLQSHPCARSITPDGFVSLKLHDLAVAVRDCEHRTLGRAAYRVDLSRGCRESYPSGDSAGPVIEAALQRIARLIDCRGLRAAVPTRRS